METVFDYNITDKERENIGISDKERYLALGGRYCKFRPCHPFSYPRG